MVAATLAAVTATAVEKNRGKRCDAWAATVVGPTDTIRVATTTQAQCVHSTMKATRAMHFWQHHGRQQLLATCVVLHH